MAVPRKTSLVLLAVALIVAASIALLRSRSKTEIDPPELSTRPETTAPISHIDGDARGVARAHWEDRRARIRAAHASRAQDDAARSHASSSRGCADGECSRDAAENGGDAVFTAFIEETTTLTQGCEELIGGKPTLVRIDARLIGAPDIGTIVESVDVAGPGESVDALTECLTEGMYTLELGDAAADFARDAVLIHGLLDEVAGEDWLTPEHVAEIRQQMIAGGLDPASDPMVAVGADDPPPTP
jgi:hypothetical protein